MAEIRTIPEKILASGIKDTSIDDVSKFDKEVIHHSAGAPDADDDTGSGYAVGSIWVDSTNGDMYTCTDATAEDASWANMEGDDINPPFTIGASTIWYSGGRADGTGQSPGYVCDEVSTFPVSSPGNATDIGEADAQTHDNAGNGAIHDDTYIYMAGGQAARSPSNAAGAKTAEINRAPISSPATFTDIGDLTAAMAIGGGGTDGDTGFSVGGDPGPGSVLTQIDKFSLASPSTTADSGGDLNTGINSNGCYSDVLNGKIFSGGGDDKTSRVDTIEVFPVSISSGTATDYAELSTVKNCFGTLANTTHGFSLGGWTPSETDTIEKFPFSAPSSNTDIGNLIRAKTETRGMGSPDSTAAGFSMGGQTSSNTIDEIDKFSLSSPGNASDWGNLVKKPASGNASGV